MNMKKFTKFVLAAAVITAGAASVSAQSYKEDPRYGATPEQREENAKSLSFLRDEVNMKNWDFARGYIKTLMNNAPAASVSLYQYGTNVYKQLIVRAKSLDEKKVLVDSVMLIYDRRNEHFGNHATQGTPYILALKARDYAALNPMDRAGVRKFYKDALDAAAGSATAPTLALEYFQVLVNDFKATELTPEELLSAYQTMSPIVENAPAEVKDGFTSLFASSGAADCAVLEDLYTKELAAKPGDKAVLAKAYGLMTMAECDSEFYISVAEQHYAAEPSSGVAIRLATLFEKKEQFDKALRYLNQMIETETDPAAKANLYFRVAASELGMKRPSAAAAAARQAIALDGNNGYARMMLAESYIAGSAACSGFQRLSVFWLAYDEFARARDLFASDAAMRENMTGRMSSCRGNFPSKEDVFMEGLTEGAGYTVSCGWISGGTSVRSR